MIDTCVMCQKTPKDCVFQTFSWCQVRKNYFSTKKISSNTKNTKMSTQETRSQAAADSPTLESTPSTTPIHKPQDREEEGLKGRCMVCNRNSAAVQCSLCNWRPHNR